MTSGPFAYVRHPMYLGLVLASLGTLAMYRTWTTLLFVAQTPILIVRARQEDRLLALAFDDDWVRYAVRVPAWLPPVR